MHFYQVATISDRNSCLSGRSGFLAHGPSPNKSTVLFFTSNNSIFGCSLTSLNCVQDCKHRKLNERLEPKNHPIEKEKSSSIHPPFLGIHVSFPGWNFKKKKSSWCQQKSHFTSIKSIGTKTKPIIFCRAKKLESICPLGQRIPCAAAIQSEFPPSRAQHSSRSAGSFLPWIPLL